MSEAYRQRKAANERYLATQDRIVIRVPKDSGLKEAIQAHADVLGESMQSFILRSIQTQMERDKLDKAKAYMRNTLDGQKDVSELSLGELLILHTKSDAE